MMYFWNMGALVQDLRENRLSELNNMHYYLANTIFVVVGSAITTAGTIFDVLNVAIILPITILGIFACFHANQEGDGQNFIERMVAIWWVATVRFFILTVLIGLALAIGFASILIVFKVSREQTQYYARIFALIVIDIACILFFLYIRKNIRKVAQG